MGIYDAIFHSLVCICCDIQHYPFTFVGSKTHTSRIYDCLVLIVFFRSDLVLK